MYPYLVSPPSLSPPVVGKQRLVQLAVAATDPTAAQQLAVAYARQATPQPSNVSDWLVALSLSVVEVTNAQGFLGSYASP